MNEENWLSAYIDNTKKLVRKEKASKGLNEVVASHDIKMTKSKYAFLFSFPLIAHLLTLLTYDSYHYTFFDALWIPFDMSRLHAEDIDHLYLVAPVVLLISGFFYYYVQAGFFDKFKNPYLDKKRKKEEIAEEDKFFVVFLISGFLLLLTLLTCANKLGAYPYTSKMYLFTLVSIALFGLNKYINKYKALKEDKAVEIKRNELSETKEEIDSLSKKQAYNKSKILETPEIMKGILREYEKPSFESHPDKDCYLSLIEGLKKQNEEILKRHNEMKELQKIYQAVYEEKIEIEDPVAITNS